MLHVRLIYNEDFNHCPFNNLIRNITPLKQSSIHIAVQTPVSPIIGASMAAKVKRTTQMLKNLNHNRFKL